MFKPFFRRENQKYMKPPISFHRQRWGRGHILEERIFQECSFVPFIQSLPQYAQKEAIDAVHKISQNPSSENPNDERFKQVLREDSQDNKRAIHRRKKQIIHLFKNKGIFIDLSNWSAEHINSLYFSIDLNLDLYGVQRIIAELASDPEKALLLASKYTDLVETISNILIELGILDDPTPSLDLFRRFLTELWSIMHSNLGIKYGTKDADLLSTCLESNEWDCDSSTFLVYDVATFLGLDMGVVIGPGHTLIALGELVFETTDELIDNLENLRQRIPNLQIIQEKQLHSLTYAHLGYGEELKGNLEHADALYALAIALNPHYAGALNNRGSVNLKMNKPRKAIKFLSRAIRINPDFFLAYNNRGLAFYERGKYPEALRDFSTAIHLNPDFSWAYSNRGAVYSALGDYESAIKDYQEGLRRNPELTEGHYNLSILQEKMGNIE